MAPTALTDGPFSYRVFFWRTDFRVFLSFLFSSSVNCVIMNRHRNMAWVFTWDAHIKTKKSQLLCDKTFKWPSWSKLFESEHNLWYHIYGYSDPEVPPNCVGKATVKCQKMIWAVEMKHNRTANVIRRIDGKYHHNNGFDEVQCIAYCKNTVIL